LSGYAGPDALPDEAGSVDTPDGGEIPDVGADTVPAEAGRDCNATSPVVYWPLDEGSGTMVRDCAKNMLPATLVGATSWVSGVDGGNALSFSGGYATAGTPPELAFTGAMSVVAWASIAAFPNEPQVRYLVSRSTDINANGWRLGVRANSQVGFAVYGSATARVEATGDVPAGWVHLAGVYRPNQPVELYVNGVLKASSSSNGPASIGSTTTEVRIGVRGDGNVDTAYSGIASDVRIYDRALTKEEVVESMK
jgi:hypothetical protein